MTQTSRPRIASDAIATNYHPLDVMIAEGSGAWVTDVQGRRYLDCLSAYSANNFGHRNALLVQAAVDQLGRQTLVSRAFQHDQLGPFCEELADLVGKDVVLPMNTGAEAVESAIKIARKWGYDVKGVPANAATIVVAGGNFHGRTTTIVGFSDDELARDGFGPFTPGFRIVPYSDLEALEAAIDATTVAVLLEPIQGEAGVVIPSEGYLAGVRRLCTANQVIFIADEIQSGLARTGATLAVEHDHVEPDLILLGKSLGGGILPVSAVVGDREYLAVLRPGTHGSTFGGNGLASAVGRAVVQMLSSDDRWRMAAATLGEHLLAGLQPLLGNGLTAVRGRGLWAGIDIDPSLGSGRDVCERLLASGVLAKDCHGQTVRLAPTLVASIEDLDWMLARLAQALS